MATVCATPCQIPNGCFFSCCAVSDTRDKRGNSPGVLRSLSSNSATPEAGPSNSLHGKRKEGELGRKSWKATSRTPSGTFPFADSQIVPITPRIQALLGSIGSLENILGDITCETFLIGASTSQGRSGAIVEPKFQEKTCIGTSDVGVQRVMLEKNGIFISCIKGKKPESPNQDNFLFCETQYFRICAVADGHGEAGHWVSHWLVKILARHLLLHLEGSTELPTDEVMRDLFDVVHRTLCRKAQVESFDVQESGATLTVIIINCATQNVLVAWTGDSRAVCGIKKGEKMLMSTFDHKPNNPEERRRIVASGGEVIKLAGANPARVFARRHESPGLAMSRAICDVFAHTIGVNHVPDTRQFHMPDGSLLLCCSDGVWEFISNKEALRDVISYGIDGVAKGVSALVEEAKNRWLEEEVTSTDDITVIAIWGKSPAS